MARQQEVFSDLTAEGNDVDRLVADLDASQWALATPAQGWAIAHQIAHLTATFRMAATAASDPEAFTALTARLSDDFDANVRAALAPYLTDPPEALLARFRAERAAAEKALAAAPNDELLPWLVRPLPPTVLAAAGMMELFGHGQDIADALGAQRERTDRIRQVVGFAVRTWDFGYLARGLTPPEASFRFELVAPSGEVWEFGPAESGPAESGAEPAGSAQKICGPAVDFCLLVTRRRHRDDLRLAAFGPEADRWLDIAQAYRGPAGRGRTPGQFARGGP